MTNIRFIGDVHGKYGPYKKLIKPVQNSIQVGDMGVGFFYDWHGEKKPHPNPPYDSMVEGKHRFIRGNHDNPAVCGRHSQWIKDGHIENGMMFIGGAVSIDAAFRTEGLSWWPDEELSTNELNVLVDQYMIEKPRIMVTHECPENVAHEICRHNRVPKFDWPSRTREAFEAMWSAHSPELWIFGHWHMSFDGVMRGTRFICLNELEYKDIET